MIVFSVCQLAGFHQKTRQRIMKILFEIKMLAALILINFLFSSAECATCSLPHGWNGKWFIYEFANAPPLTITSNSSSISRISTDVNQELGKCIWQDRDFYVFQNEKAKCNKCVLFSEKHKNVLYTKEGYCERDSIDPEDLCRLLKESHENDHYFWFRVDYKPITCPFVGSAFQFSYRKGYGASCATPMSHASACIENTRFELRYEACHDYLYPVGKTEQMTCVGGWEDSGIYYLISDVARINNHGERSLQDSYRCFIYRKNSISNFKPLKPQIVTGYVVGTSDLATCNELYSPEEAATTLYFKKDLYIDTDEEKPCKFPSWFGPHRWMDTSKTFELQLSPHSKNRSLRSQPISRYQNIPKMELSSSTRNTFFLLSNSNFVCLGKMNMTDSDENVAIVAKYIVGCKIDVICLHLIKRSKYIFQMYYLEDMDMDKAVIRHRCFNATFAGLRQSVTMIGNESAVPDNLEYPLDSQTRSESTSGCNAVKKLEFKSVYYMTLLVTVLIYGFV